MGERLRAQQEERPPGARASAGHRPAGRALAVHALQRTAGNAAAAQLCQAVQRDAEEEAQISAMGDDVTLGKLPVDLAAVAGMDVTSIGGAISGIQAAIDFAKAKAGGQTTAEAAASTTGGVIGQTAVAAAAPKAAGLDAVVNAVDAAVKSAEGPRRPGDTSAKPSDATTMAADSTPSKIASGYGGMAVRTVTSLAQGDTEGVNRTSSDVNAGKYGTPLQGIHMALQLAQEAIRGGDLHRVVAQGQDSAAARVGNALGDAAADAAGHRPSNIEFAARNIATDARVMAETLARVGPPIPFASWEAWAAAGAPPETPVATTDGSAEGAGGAPGH